MKVKDFKRILELSGQPMNEDYTPEEKAMVKKTEDSCDALKEKINKNQEIDTELEHGEEMYGAPGSDYGYKTRDITNEVEYVRANAKGIVFIHPKAVYAYDLGEYKEITEEIAKIFIVAWLSCGDEDTGDIDSTSFAFGYIQNETSLSGNFNSDSSIKVKKIGKYTFEVDIDINIYAE